MSKNITFTRNDLKKSSMISGYGAGRKLVSAQFAEDYDGEFSEVYVDLFYEAQAIVSPAAVILRDTFINIWDPSWTDVSWTLPDSFTCVYRPTETRSLKLNAFGVELEVLATMNVATSRATALGVNIIHSVDAYIARQMVLRNDFAVWPIHDGFSCLPNNVPAMRQTYKNILSDIAESRLLEDMIQQITGQQQATIQ